MESKGKVIRSRRFPNQQINTFILFQIYKPVQYGSAVFVCGNLTQIGNWNTVQALRLEWNQNDIWKGTIEISKDISKCIEFKFIISDWRPNEISKITWEEGPNRIIDLKISQSRSVYCTLVSDIAAEWNKQYVTLCLRVHPNPQRPSLYYVTGGIQELGNWKQKKQLQQVETDLNNMLNNYLNSSKPQSIIQPSITSLLFYRFTIKRTIQNFNYFYTKWGETAQSQTYPGRIAQIFNRNIESETRILDIQILGEKIIIDESIFDQLVLQKMTNQIYLASCLKNSTQFTKILDKHITALVHLQSTQETCSISSSHIKSMCKENGLFFKNWTVETTTNHNFVEQAQEIISILQNLVVDGHRVCIHCSKRVLREGPIKILYLTLLGGCSFMEALQITSKEIPLSENNCKVAQDVLVIVSQRMGRGKIAIPSN